MYEEKNWMDGDGYMCDDDDDDDDDHDHDHDYDYDRDETQCMLVDWYASQRFSSQVCKWGCTFDAS